MGKFGPVAVLLLALVGIWVFLPEPGPSKAELEARERTRVQTVCQSAVSRRLVSPGSMRVVSRGEPRAEREGVWTHTLTVDSQNRAGALLRSRWSCRVRDGLVETLTQLD